MSENNKINWFPGHMSKTLRLFEEQVKKVNAIIYILDARAPFSCFNPSIDKIVDGKPILFVLNKIDIANGTETRLWKNYLEEKGYSVICVSSIDNTFKKSIIDALKNMLATKINRNKEKGISTIFRAMVVGVPNSGKSTLVNTLAGAKRAVTGDKPGVTKNNQWIKIDDNYEVLDTPGTLWPNLSNQVVAENLSLIGSISDDVIDEERIAFVLIERLSKICPQLFMDRYKLTSIDEDLMVVFDEICKKRGCILKGNEMNYSKCAKILLDDFRKCRIGKITLDKAPRKVENEK